MKQIWGNMQIPINILHLFPSSNNNVYLLFQFYVIFILVFFLEKDPTCLKETATNLWDGMTYDDLTKPSFGTESGV